MEYRKEVGAAVILGIHNNSVSSSPFAGPFHVDIIFLPLHILQLALIPQRQQNLCVCVSVPLGEARKQKDRMGRDNYGICSKYNQGAGKADLK